MKVSDGPLQGLKIIELPVHRDERGFFIERFNLKRFSEAGLPHIFMQDNHSYSLPRVLRGLHYQYAPPQGKLVGAISGRIYDVAVDIRPDSDTYGKYFGIELSAENGTLLWVPAGFAHGFCVLGDQPADVLYKVSSIYHKMGEGGLRYDDPELAIQWPVADPIVLERDKLLPSFATYKQSPPQWPA